MIIKYVVTISNKAEQCLMHMSFQSASPQRHQIIAADDHDDDDNHDHDHDDHDDDDNDDDDDD